MAAGSILVDEGTTTHLATHTFSEGGDTKHASRSVLNDATGADFGTSGNPVRTDPTGSTAQPVTNAGTFAVQNSAATPAGTNLIGKVSAGDDTSVLYDGTTALTPKFAAISASASGNNTVVSAVTSKKIRVLAYNFIAAGTVNAKFQSGAGGTDLTGLKYCVANSGLVAPYNPAGWFETASNTLLNLNLSAAVAVGGELTYVEV